MSRMRMLRRRPLVPMAYSPSPFFAPMNKMADELADRARRMFEEPWADWPELTPTLAFPAVDVSESAAEFTVKAELPGLTAKDVTLDFANGALTIRGEKQEERNEKEEDKKFYLWERTFGSFQRTLPFPGGIAEDKIVAEFKDGVLTVRLPKAAETPPRKRPIEIKA